MFITFTNYTLFLYQQIVGYIPPPNTTFGTNPNDATIEIVFLHLTPQKILTHTHMLG